MSRGCQAAVQEGGHFFCPKTQPQWHPKRTEIAFCRDFDQQAICAENQVKGENLLDRHSPSTQHSDMSLIFGVRNPNNTGAK